MQKNGSNESKKMEHRQMKVGNRPYGTFFGPSVRVVIQRTEGHARVVTQQNSLHKITITPTKVPKATQQNPAKVCKANKANFPSAKISAHGDQRRQIPSIKRKPVSNPSENVRPNDSGKVAATKSSMGNVKPQKRLAKVGAIKSSMGNVKPQKRLAEEDTCSEDSFSDDSTDYKTVIRQMFGYNPSEYGDDEDFDDREMEADFDSMQREEKRSAKIAREEDERELALLEEEERREKSRKAKKQKR